MNLKNKRRLINWQKQKENPDKKWNRANIILNGILALATVLIYILATRQTDVATKAMDSQKKSDSMTIAISESSAAIARRNANASEFAMKIQLSPYPQVSKIHASQLEVGKDFSFEVELINFGQTPAFNFSAKSTIEWGDSVQLKEFLKRNIQLRKTSKVLPPNLSTIIFGGTISGNIITQPFIDLLHKRKIGIRVRTIIEYKNRWNEQSRNEVCHSYVPNRNVFMDCQ